MANLRQHPRVFASQEDGALSWFGIIPLFAVLIILGIALDVTNAIQQRTHLQVAADAAAHAALFTRNNGTEPQAVAAALDIAERNMPAAEDGKVLQASDIVFGVWNADTRTFTPSPGSRDAVRVVTQQREANGNAVGTYLLRLAGFESWDVRAGTTMETFRRNCHLNGFIAEAPVDIQSNNHFKNCFCIHSNTHVEVNQGNTFEPCTSVTMPDESLFKMPASGFEQNTGLREALDTNGYTIKELAQLPGLIDSLERGWAAYVEGESPKFLKDMNNFDRLNNVRDISQSDLKPNTVYNMTCPGNGQVNVKRDTTFDRVVLITGCKLKFESGVSLRDSIIATRNTDARSISGPSGIQIGDHTCGSSGGSAQILTLGGAQFGSGLTFKSGQIIARGDVQFPARDFSVEGASVIAGGRIDGTSNMSMAFCEDKDNGFFTADYFRIVQ